MSEKPQDNSENKSSDNIDSITPNIVDSGEVSNINQPEQKEESNGQENSKSENNKNRANKNIVINWPEIILQAFLTIGTFLLLIEAHNTTKIAADSLELTRKEITKRDSIYRIKDSLEVIKEASNRKKDSINQFLTIQSIEAQIEYFKSNQRQVKLTNRPFLKIENTFIDTIRDDKIEIEFSITNLSNIPVEMSQFRYVIKHSEIDEPCNVNELNNMEYSYISGYANSVHKAKFTAEFKYKIADAKKHLNSGHLFLCLVGDIKYQNVSTKENRVFRFGVILHGYPSRCYLFESVDRKQ